MLSFGQEHFEIILNCILKYRIILGNLSMCNFNFYSSLLTQLGKILCSMVTISISALFGEKKFKSHK